MLVVGDHAQIRSDFIRVAAAAGGLEAGERGVDKGRFAKGGGGGKVDPDSIAR